MSAWKPSRGVEIIAGTPPGGGLDRVARALVKAIGEAKLVDVPLAVINVPGGGARKAWTQVIDKHTGDAHVVAIPRPTSPPIIWSASPISSTASTRPSPRW